MKKTILNLLWSLQILIAICLGWQGMHEFYKFDEADNYQAVYSLLMSFLVIFLSTITQTINQPPKGE